MTKIMQTNQRMQFSRRNFVGLTGCLAVAPWWQTASAEAYQDSTQENTSATVVGHPQAAAVGRKVLASGGNAVDAIVAGAFMAGVVALPSTGIGGYGGTAVIGGLPDGRVSAIDFNGTAPMAMRESQYEAMGDKGEQSRMSGWTSVGVPGVLAGLQKLVDLHGTWPLARLMEPAIQAASDGFALTEAMAKQIASNAKRFQRDPGSTKLFLPGGTAPQSGETFRNPDLAKLLERLAKDGRVDAFYKGEFAETIARQSQQHGGWLTKEDMERFEARKVEPIQLYWGDATLHTLPPTCGGLTVLQTLHTLIAMNWPNGVAPEHREIALVEAMRLAWHDRLTKLGDPQFAFIPRAELLSRQKAEQSSARVRESLSQAKPLTGQSDGRAASGTIHLNAVDENGMSVALTFTHGDGFGSHVTVDGLGLLMGHGLSRFDPEPGKANSPASGKRPLHNMCPTLVTRGDKVVLAIGATGGRKIVSAVTNVLAHYLGSQMSIDAAIKMPRLHCEGGLDVLAEQGIESSALTRFGYVVNRGAVANLTAIELAANKDQTK